MGAGTRTGISERFASYKEQDDGRNIPLFQPYSAVQEAKDAAKVETVHFRRKKSIWAGCLIFSASSIITRAVTTLVMLAGWRKKCQWFECLIG
jgi:hypothetical protein